MLAVILGSIVTFVPMYATPTASQLPIMLGRIGGVAVVEPPASDLGDYIAPGNVTAIARWLQMPPARNGFAFVISTDMLAYGGLDPSRVPGGVSEDAAIARLKVLSDTRARHPHAFIGAFGTIMRLEPTSVTRTGEATNYSQIAQYPTWEYIWNYAQLHDPPLPSESAEAAHLRNLIGDDVLRTYLSTRVRDRNVDLAELDYVADGLVDRFVIGQDDAGPVGLHVKDVQALSGRLAGLQLDDRASIEPGADELGLALVAHAMARGIGWTPRVAVAYSTPAGAQTQDPLEYAPISTTIDALIRLSGAIQDDAHPDITMFVRVPHTTAVQDNALLQSLQRYVAAGKSAALVDLTYLTHSYAAQAAFVRRIIAAHIAGALDAYSSWNTDANSVGIALSEAVAAGVGRRTAKYNPIAHAEFMFDRYIDDYLYHTDVRPQLNEELTARGVTEHYWLSQTDAKWADQRMAQLMLPKARALLAEIYPRYKAGKLRIFLPWPRTAEIRSELSLH